MDSLQLIRVLFRRIYPLLVGLLLGAWVVCAHASAPEKFYISTPQSIFGTLSDVKQAVMPKICTSNATKTCGSCNWIEKWDGHFSCDGLLNTMKYCSEIAAPGGGTMIDCVTETQGPYDGQGSIDYAGMKCHDGSVPDATKPLSQQCKDPCLLPNVENPTTGVCEDPCIGQKGKIQNGQVEAGGGSNINVCFGQCEATVSNAEFKTLKGPGGKTFVVGSWMMTGTVGQCANDAAGNAQTKLPKATAPSPNTASPTTCAAKNQAYGEVNGQAMCLPPSDQNIVTTSKTTAKTTNTTSTDANGNTTTDGNNKSSQVTVIDNGNGDPTVQTTTTTTNPDGSTTTTTTQQPKSSFCAENTGLQLCKNSTYGDTDCAGSQPLCDGDAVACATAAHTWQLNCALNKKGAQSELGELLAAGTDPDQAGLPSKDHADEIDIAQQIADAEANGGGLGGGTCPADKTISIMGKTVVIPFAQTCPYLQMVGNLVVAASLVGAMFIVGKG